MKYALSKVLGWIGEEVRLPQRRVDLVKAEHLGRFGRKALRGFEAATSSGGKDSGGGAGGKDKAE